MFKKLVNSIKVLYGREYPLTVVYMLQSANYRPLTFLHTFWNTQDFSKVRGGQAIKKSTKNNTLIVTLRVGIVIEIVAGLVVAALSISNHLYGGLAYGLAIILFYPVLWSLLMGVVVVVSNLLSKAHVS
jgi:hypothetical protein